MNMTTKKWKTSELKRILTLPNILNFKDDEGFRLDPRLSEEGFHLDLDYS
jgi:hypothetical protein